MRPYVTKAVEAPVRTSAEYELLSRGHLEDALVAVGSNCSVLLVMKWLCQYLSLNERDRSIHP